MLKPKTDREFFELNYRLITELEIDSYAFEVMIKLYGSAISSYMSDSITDEQIMMLINNMYENIDFKQYEEYRYWFEDYFLAMYLIKLKEEIIAGNIQPSERYADYIEKSTKSTLFDRFKLMLTSDIFFDYLKDKYYYLKPDKVIAREYYKDRLKFYKMAEKLLFFNKYKAFSVMQDFYYNAKRTAKYHFKTRAWISSENGKGSIVIKLIFIQFLAAVLARILVNLHYR